MPPGKFVQIVIAVLVAAAATVWLATLVAATVHVPLGFFVLIPAVLIGTLALRVIASRPSNPKDNHHERIEK